MYDSSGRSMKTDITSMIIHHVKESSGRFLKKDSFGEWTEVADEVARLKASSAFRTWRTAIIKVGRSINNDPTNV
jgi:hypothetical protein